MSMNDTISDLLTRIRNGQMSNKEKVTIPYSKMKEALCKVMLEEGYIEGINVEESEYKNIIVDLKYYDGKPVIDLIQRVSRPGLRIYKSYYMCLALQINLLILQIIYFQYLNVVFLLQ